jgi:hypothetical protein
VGTEDTACLSVARDDVYDCGGRRLLYDNLLYLHLCPEEANYISATAGSAVNSVFLTTRLVLFCFRACL